MKKFLMTGIAALAIGAAFVSCSHEIEPYSEEELQQFEVQKIKANYEQAFIKTFGKPASNQDWGFSDNAKTRALGDYKTKGTMTASFTFPSDCDANKFDPDLTNIPSYDAYCAKLGNENWTPDEFDCGEGGSAPVLIRSTKKAGKIKVKAEVQFPGTHAPTPAELELESVAYDIPLCFVEQSQGVHRGQSSQGVRQTVLSDAEKAKMLQEVEAQQADFGLQK